MYLDKDDGDYVMSNSFVGETSNEQDVIDDDFSDTNDEVTSIEASDLMRSLSIYEPKKRTFIIKFDINK